jgi:hypothetical protein
LGEVDIEQLSNPALCCFACQTTRATTPTTAMRETEKELVHLGDWLRLRLCGTQIITESLRKEPGKLGNWEKEEELRALFYFDLFLLVFFWFSTDPHLSENGKMADGRLSLSLALLEPTNQPTNEKKERVAATVVVVELRSKTSAMAAPFPCGWRKGEPNNSRRPRRERVGIDWGCCCCWHKHPRIPTNLNKKKISFSTTPIPPPNGEYPPPLSCKEEESLVSYTDT